MTTQPMGSESIAGGPSWPQRSATYNRAQLLAALRALFIAMALIGALALIVLS